MIKKQCLYCKKTFETKYNFKKYCSVNCKNNAIYYKNHEKIRKRKNQFQNLKYKTQKKIKTKKCEFCNKEFEYWHSSTKFCNTQCRRNFNYKQNKNSKYIPVKLLTKNEHEKRKKNQRDYYQKNKERIREK